MVSDVITFEHDQKIALGGSEDMAALIEERILPNGLRMEIRDESRKLAGDRWLVCIHTLVPIPLSKTSWGEISGETLDLLHREVGETVYYQQRLTRHFVAEKELPGVLENLKKTFLDNFLPYLSHPDFARRFFKKTSREIQEQGRSGPEYLQKFLAGLRPPKDNSQGPNSP